MISPSGPPLRPSPPLPARRRHFDGRARRRLTQRNRDAGRQVLATDGSAGGAEAAEPTASPASGTEHSQNVLETAGRACAESRAFRTGELSSAEHRGEHVLELRGGSAACGEPRPARSEGANRVVFLAVGLVGQHLVGLADLLETILRRFVARIAIGVVLARELAIGLLDLLVRSLLGDSERLVEILLHPVLASHRVSPPCSCTSASHPCPFVYACATRGRRLRRAPLGRSSRRSGTPAG